MYSNEYVLGMNDEVRRMLRQGEAERFGGVIRRVDNKRVVAWLRDVDLETDTSLCPSALMGAIPIAILGASLFAINQRLMSIESKIQKVQETLEGVRTGVDASNIKLDATMLGKLRGSLQACHLEIEEKRLDNLIAYRRNFIESYNKIIYVAKELAGSARQVRERPQEIVEYLKAAILSGIAARDVSVYAGEYESARMISKQLREDMMQVHASIGGVVDAPSALFWQEESHIDALCSVIEYRKRIISHDLALCHLPKSAIEALGKR